MTFGEALDILKTNPGSMVARSGWNGKGMWITLSPGSIMTDPAKFWAPANRAFAEMAIARVGSVEVLPCLTMKTADNKILMGWLASQTDMLADDWDIVV